MRLTNAFLNLGLHTSYPCISACFNLNRSIRAYTFVYTVKACILDVPWTCGIYIFSFYTVSYQILQQFLCCYQTKSPYKWRQFMLITLIKIIKNLNWSFYLMYVYVLEIVMEVLPSSIQTLLISLSQNNVVRILVNKWFG